MDPFLQLRTLGAAHTQKLAATVASVLRAGDVVSLTGELGAGKTCFVQGAARALGVTDPVTSPSFLLRRDYRGAMPVLHLDVYRLDALQEVIEIGYEDVVDQHHVTFIEWGDAMSQLLPQDYLEVELRLGEPGPLTDGDEERDVLLRAHGDDWRRRLGMLERDLQSWLVDPAGRSREP